VDTFIAGLHAKEPDRRYQSAAEVATVLEEAMSGTRLPEAPPAGASPAARRQPPPEPASTSGGFVRGVCSATVAAAVVYICLLKGLGPGWAVNIAQSSWEDVKQTLLPKKRPLSQEEKDELDAWWSKEARRPGKIGAEERAAIAELLKRESSPESEREALWRDPLYRKRLQEAALHWIDGTDAKTRGDFGTALARFRKSCELTAWKEPRFIFALARCYADAGRTNEAVESQQKGLSALGERSPEYGERLAELKRYQAAAEGRGAQNPPGEARDRSR
jgi:hypothetical protein